MRPGFLAAVMIGVLARSSGAMANDHPHLDAQAILAQQGAIRAEAGAGVGRYKGMAEPGRDELLTLHDRVTALLANRARTTDLPEADQIGVFNALQAISAIVNQAEDGRMICERSRPVGSNRPQTVCRSVAQRRPYREAAANQVSYRDQQCFKDASGNCIWQRCLP